MTHFVLDLARQTISANLTDARPLLVWYDRDATLADIIEEATPDGATFIRFDGSYLKVKSCVEQDYLKMVVEGTKPSLNWIVYIPQQPEDPSWIRDYETIIGTRIECTLESLLATHLAFGIDMELHKLLSGPAGRALASNWNKAMGPAKPPFDRSDVTRGLLAIAFSLGADYTIGRAVLEYICYADRCSEQLDRLHLHEVFADAIRDELGLSRLPRAVPVPAERLAAAVLLSELVVKSEGLGAKEFELLLPENDKRSQWANLADEWANDSRLREAFVAWSDKLSRQYDVESKLAGFEALINVGGFSAVDDVLIEKVCAGLSRGGYEALTKQAAMLLRVAEIRSKTVWASFGRGKVWDAIKVSMDLLSRCDRAEELLRNLPEEIDGLIGHYMNDNGWWQLDDLYLKLHSVDPTLDERVRSLIVQPAFRCYGQWLQAMTMKFSDSTSRLRTWSVSSLPKQLDFWETTVRPLAEAKVAVFLVDALRYDLCKRLSERLQALGARVRLEPMLGSIPSITQVGMASILPHDGKSLCLELVDDRLHVTLDKEIELTSTADRMKWIRTCLGSCAVIDLEELLALSSLKLKCLVEANRTIVVMHRDVDQGEAGTFLQGISVTVLESIYTKLAIASIRLHEGGIRNVVITTDHGFLIVPEEWRLPSMEALPCSGLTKRRYAVGSIAKKEGFVFFPIEASGLLGDGLLAFPKGLYMLPLQGEAPRFVHGGLSPQEVCIACIVSQLERARKVQVKLEIPEVIGSALLTSTVSPVEPSTSERSRFVQVRVIGEREEQIGESDAIEVHLEGKRVRLKLRKLPSTVEIRLIDTDTEEVLQATTKQASALSGYDEGF
jgi:hypothetical protein